MAVYEEPTPELIEKYKELGYYPKPEDFEPVPDYPEGHALYGKPRCQGWNSFKGRQCRGLAVVSRGVGYNGKLFDKCRRHGGGTLRGKNHPFFKTGEYSYAASLPERLLDKFANISADTDIMDMRPRAALLEVRIMELLEGLDEQGSHEVFKRLKAKMGEYRKYSGLAKRSSSDRQADYLARAARALNQVSELIDQGLSDAYKWIEIKENTEAIRKLAETQNKQIKTAEIAVMADRVLVFAAVMAQIFREQIASIKVLDEKEKAKIIEHVDRDVEKLITQGDYTATIDV